ncbi:MAG: substrate-binding domain-containing protein [Magnetococcales bacterium]|nr:substrate-binding domain-containing protein [Magnetococcales bacterium]
MNTIRKWRRWGIGTVLLLATVMSAYGESLPNQLRGAPFTSPEKKVTMPQKWLAKPIIHAEDAQGVDLVINMDQQFYFMLEPLIVGFAKEKGWKVKLIEGTCGTAEAMLRRKNLDIGGFCCPPALTDRLPGLEFHTLGLQSVALLVHPSNPVTNVTIGQLRDIYQNKINNWNELSTPEGGKGPDLPIRAVLRAHCNLRPGHWRLILDNKDLFGPRILDVGSIDDMVLEVSRNPSAIGYEELPTVRRLGKGSMVKTIQVNGVAPDDSMGLAQGRYPVYQLINLSIWTEDHTKSDKAIELVEHLKDQMEHLDPQNHFVPTRILRHTGWKFTGPEVTGEPELMEK